MSKFVVRTVRNGQVVIGKKIYRPRSDYKAYDGRLDGLRMIFGRYRAPWLPDGYEPFVSLWGTEADHSPWPGPACVDGIFPWDFWYSSAFT